jgi:hypothetical protein
MWVSPCWSDDCGMVIRKGARSGSRDAIVINIGPVAGGNILVDTYRYTHGAVYTL